jgi:NitT/TauT family transport system substrate-binding protein
MNLVNRRTVLKAGAATACLPGVSGPAIAQGKGFILQGGSPTPNAYYVPYYIAQEVGFFRDEGLEVEVRYSRGAPLAAQLVATGAADAASISFEPVIIGYEKGVRGRFFYQQTTSVIYYMAIPVDSAIKDVSRLAGKKVGVASLGSAAIPIARAILRSAKVDPKGVAFVPVGVAGQAAGALRAGQVDALALWDAPYAGLESLGLKFNYFREPELLDVGNSGLFTSDQSIANRPKDLEGVTRAVAKGTVFMLENLDAALKIYWKVNPAAKIGTDEQSALANGRRELEFVAKAFAILKDKNAKYGELRPAEIKKFIEVISREEELKAPPSVNDIIAPQFVDAANNFDVDAVRKMADGWRG